MWAHQDLNLGPPDYEAGEITKITYTGNLKHSATPNYEVDFTYTGRNDVNRYYISGGSISQNHLLSSITVKYGAETVQSYQINYNQTGLYPRIQSLSTTDGKGNAMNPTLFYYGTKKSGFTPLSTNIYKWGEDIDYTMGDFNGDGKTDMACAYYTIVNGNKVFSNWSVFYSTGDGTTFTEVPEGSLPYDFEYFISGDFNGDGMDDLVEVENGSFTYLLSTGDSFSQGGSQAYYSGGTTYNSPALRNIDLNGNGKDEVLAVRLFNGVGVIWDYELDGNNIPKNIFHYNNYDQSQNYYEFTYPSSISNPVFGAGDFTGDGKTNLIINTQTNSSTILQYDEATGTLEPINSGSYSFPTSTTSKYLGDFNGDGITDLFTDASGQWTVMFFDGKNGSADAGWISKFVIIMISPKTITNLLIHPASAIPFLARGTLQVTVRPI